MPSIEEAARSGCRSAVVRGATTADVESEIANIMVIAGINDYESEINPAALDDVPQWAPVTVTVAANVEAFSWVPLPRFLGGVTITGAYAVSMASYAASLGIKVHTISLGDDADWGLMTQIASATGGRHFIADGSGSYLTNQLKNAFVSVASDITKTTIVP